MKRSSPKRGAFVAALLVGAALLTGGRTLAADTLTIGDPAPKIAVKEFVKGAPVPQFKPGSLYVVEFWATWCGPCKVSIPHLTELQKKYKDVTFIGVSAFETDPSKVKPFVTEMGDKMDYRVAMDAVPAGAKGTEGAMAQAWMEAAGENGIPTAFIVGRDGKIAWIGHPMAMDQPLQQVVAGNWDVNKAVAERKAAKAQGEKMAAVQAKLAEASKSGDPAKLIAVLDEAIASDPAMEMSLGGPKFQMLARQPGASSQAATYGNHLVADVYQDNPGALNQIAWFLVDPANPQKDKGLLTLGLKAAQRADTLTKGKEPAIADTLAAAYFANGDVKKAIETQERAIKATEGTPDKDMLDHLEMYKKGAAGK